MPENNLGFGDVVVVDETEIGVIVKSWDDGTRDVYVRNANGILTYHVKQIKKYIHNKDLHGSEIGSYDPGE